MGRSLFGILISYNVARFIVQTALRRRFGITMHIELMTTHRKDPWEGLLWTLITSSIVAARPALSGLSIRSRLVRTTSARMVLWTSNQMGVSYFPWVQTEESDFGI